MFSLLKAKPTIDADSQQWLHDMYEWCFTWLNADLFYNKTQLILPNDQFFPGRVSSEHEFAENVYRHVAKYSHMQHWGLQPINLLTAQPRQIALPEYTSARSEQALAVSQVPVPYHPRQVKHPEAMISTTVQQLGQMLVTYVDQPIPGNDTTRVWASEVIGVFMGFGIMFANTAYEFRGGCGCSYDPSKNRPAQLAQPETLFALAMFCHFKKIKASQVTPHLKPHLRSALKQNIKYLAQQEKSL